ncbi:hypothetical protein A4G18_04605 [Pasteurellaceae bacterium Pebbles2]|nr:hypothetical protein [Pasteurellaceae bacterium Pebbles2]
MKADKPVECVGCNTFDVGSILDNSELEVKFDKIYPTQAEAEKALEKLVQKARDTESESDPCQIETEIIAVDGGFQVKANFVFSCQAEVVIFQLGTRAV